MNSEEIDSIREDIRWIRKILAQGTGKFTHNLLTESAFGILDTSFV